jgi:hypothetical protein
MAKQATRQPSAYERSLVDIVRTLPIERVIQILDYACYIQSQAIEDFRFLDEDETEEEILADEAVWEAQFAATQAGLNKMAEQVRAEIRAGRTMPMVFKDEGLLLVFHRHP